MLDAKDEMAPASDMETEYSTYVLQYHSPYEFDDGDGPGHEICWSQQSRKIQARSDEEARQKADAILNDPERVVVLWNDRGAPQEISLSKLL